jgi:endonuclease-3 related protein
VRPDPSPGRGIELEAIYSALHRAYGPQNWWPAQTEFEIAVGAILVQRTSWRNAELALEALRSRGLLEPSRLKKLSHSQLSALVRSSGFARAKAAYLLDLSHFVIDNCGIDSLRKRPTVQLRSDLLQIHGIGPETADSILLYLFNRAAWVVDAYATRMFTRLSGEVFDSSRQRQLMRPWAESGRTSDMQELHALIVAHAKAHCRSRARCEGCPLETECEFPRRGGGAAKI